MAIDRNALAQQLGYAPQYLPPTLAQIMTPQVGPPPLQDLANPNLLASNKLEFDAPTQTFGAAQEDQKAAEEQLKREQYAAAFMRATEAIGSGDLKKAAPLAQQLGVDPTGIAGITPQKIAEEKKTAESVYTRTKEEKGEKTELARQAEEAAKIKDPSKLITDAPAQTGTGSSFDASKIPSFGSTIIPGHEVRKVSPTTEAYLREGAAEKREAIGEKTQAELNAIAQQAANQQRLAEAHRQLSEGYEARERGRQAIIDQHLEDQANLADDIRNFKVDPSKAFGDGVLGGFRRIAAIISVSLGGYAAGLRGGPNLGAQMVDSMIDKEIDAQKTELEKRKGLLSESRSLLAQKMQQFGDMRIAEAAAKADALEAVKAQIEASMANANSDIVKANGKLLLAQADDELGRLNNEIMGWQGPTVGGNPSQKRYNDLVDKLVSEKRVPIDQAKAMAAQMVFGIDAGAGSMAIPDPHKGSGGGKMQAIVSRLASLKTIRGELQKEIATVEKGTSATQTDWNQSETRHAVLPGALASAIDGSSSDTKVKLYEDALGSPVGVGGAVLQTSRLAKLRAVMQAVDDAERNLRSEVGKAGEGTTGMSDEPADEALTTAQPLE